MFTKLIMPIHLLGFRCGSAGKESACKAGDLGSIPGLGRSSGEGKRLPTPVFWQIVHGIAESDMTEWLSLSLSYVCYTFSDMLCDFLISNSKGPKALWGCNSLSMMLALSSWKLRFLRKYSILNNASED